MGWSCAAAAGRTMDAWTRACVAQTKSSNVYHDGGSEFFWEVSLREHDDGAITGSIMRVVAKRPDGTSSCRKVGAFRIEPDGSVKRGPAMLKRAVQA